MPYLVNYVCALEECPEELLRQTYTLLELGARKQWFDLETNGELWTQLEELIGRQQSHYAQYIKR